ncbi:neuropeptide CCHamide-1 receptor-like [Panonychus citri]|uniref:neuropeptide CCHamide-1 receptor-like n=1 Tax=Panonychus citri TaxID=50023 RepID=UPI002307EB4D|nr:neuropeptide CCHamide-1 receptor-like [Panonychus citri]XP_053204949.1 neuropeptide CCHamide-1 receptor-like [Panonychus citri]XP_053213316.1 neuropeptide CCHamide-1 receptor-like [Panonychus citri]
MNETIVQIVSEVVPSSSYYSINFFELNSNSSSNQGYPSLQFNFDSLSTISSSSSSSSPSSISLNNENSTILTDTINLKFNGTLSDNDTYVPYEYRPETYIVPIVFGILFIIGLIGNGTIIFVFLRNKSMRTIPNTYIISLSIGDLLIITGALPFVSTIYSFDSWPYGQFLCKLSEFVRDVSIGVTVFSLTVLSADRYMAIVLPLKRFTSTKHKELTLTITASIWTIASLLAFPGAYNSFVMQIPITPEKTISICYPFPASLGTNYAKFIVLTKFIILYALPLFIISVFYLAMARHLLANTQRSLSATSSNGINQTHLRLTKARTKVAKTVLSFIILFAICFFPNHVFMIWFYFYPISFLASTPFWHYVRIVGFILAFGNSCLNPVALYIVSGSFRTHFDKYLFRCLKKTPNYPSFTRDAIGSSIHSSSHRPINSISSRSFKESTSTSLPITTKGQH